VKRHLLLPGALAVLVVVGGAVAAGAFSIPSNAVTVDGVSISRATVNSDLATIQQNAAFGCYLDASVAVRSGNTAGLPSINGTGRSGTYSTAYVDFWLSELVNNVLIERLAARQHLVLDATAVSAGHADLVNSISSTLSSAAAASGQSAVCAPSGQALVATLPSGFVAELTRSQAAGDLVLAHAAGYGLDEADLSRYFVAHQGQFDTICLSAIQTATQASAADARSAIEGGQSFAAAASADSTDTTSAANGGALGCFSANEGAYATVAADVQGLGVGEVSQPISNNGSYLILEVTSDTPAAFDAVVPAVRQAVLNAGSTKGASELAKETKQAAVSIDPRYGHWAGGSGIGVVPPASPPAADLLTSKA
jgi:hypothetical protein